MRKIILFFSILISLNLFSNEKKTCTFINPSDNLIKKIIKKINKEEKINDFFCDINNMKTLYYIIQDGEYSLNLGIKLEIKDNMTYGELRTLFEKKLFEYVEFLTEIKKDQTLENEFKNIFKLNARFYGTNEKDQIRFYFGRYIEDIEKNTVKFIAYGRNKKNLEEIGIFKNINVEYSDEEEVIF